VRIAIYGPTPLKAKLGVAKRSPTMARASDRRLALLVKGLSRQPYWANLENNVPVKRLSEHDFGELIESMGNVISGWPLR